MSTVYEIASSTRNKVVLRRAQARFIHLHFQTAYSKTNAVNLAILATAAYAKEQNIRDFLFKGGKDAARKTPVIDAPNVSSCVLTESEENPERIEGTFVFTEKPSSDTQLFSFHTAGYVLIAVRGTESLKDGISDANAHRVPYGEGVGMVHEGFYRAFKSVQRAIDDAVLQAEGRPVICCGHSLGGAVATLAATYIRKRHRRPVMLYTFGCPLTGDAEFARHFSSVDPIIAYRFVHNRDLVTMVPPPNANLRVSLLPLALANPIYLIPATCDPFGKPYTHFGKLVFIRRVDPGSFSVDVDRKSPAYIRIPDSIPVHEERPKWDKVLNWANVSVEDHFMKHYVSILGSDLKYGILAYLEASDIAARNVRNVLDYLDREIQALEAMKTKLENEALMSARSAAPADATATEISRSEMLTPSEKLYLIEDVLGGKRLELAMQRAHLAAVSSPAYPQAVLKEIIDRSMSPSLKQEFEYQRDHLAY
jgi:hypothetical protein